MASQNVKLLDALATGTSAEVDISNSSEHAVVVEFGPGTSAGAVTVEEAGSAGFSGTWSTIGSAIAWAAASRAHVMRFTGVGRRARLRISTNIVGGTVSAWFVSAR